MKKISLKLQLAGFLVLFLALISFQERNADILIRAVVAAVTSILVDGLCGFARDRRFKFSESALITGLLIGFVLSAQEPVGTTLAACALAILSKHLIRIKGQHLFNPAAFGALAAVVVFPSGTEWYGASLWYLIIPLGIYFVSRLKRLPTVLAFYLTAAVLTGAQAWLQRTSFIDGILYLNHFFIFIMLIEPKTSPFDKRGMIGFGALASILCFGASFENLPFSGELPALLLMNVLNAAYQRLKGGKR